MTDYYEKLTQHNRSSAYQQYLRNAMANVFKPSLTKLNFWPTYPQSNFKRFYLSKSLFCFFFSKILLQTSGPHFFTFHPIVGPRVWWGSLGYWDPEEKLIRKSRCTKQIAILKFYKIRSKLRYVSGALYLCVRFSMSC